MIENFRKEAESIKTQIIGLGKRKTRQRANRRKRY